MSARETCKRCGCGLPTQEEWETKPGGWGPELCWGDAPLCEQKRYTRERNVEYARGFAAGIEAAAKECEGMMAGEAHGSRIALIRDCAAKIRALAPKSDGETP
jgi:hypothetical protein